MHRRQPSQRRSADPSPRRRIASNNRARRGTRAANLASALTAAALSTALFTLPSTNAGFADVTDDPGNAWAADTLDPTRAKAEGGTNVNLGWIATADTYATGHRIYRSTTSGGPYTPVADVTPRTTATYIDNPAPGTYYYVIRAYYLSWESTDTNEVTASVIPPNPGDTKNCGDFTTQAEAQAWFDLHFPYYGDVGRLDGDNDGVPCESLP